MKRRWYVAIGAATAMLAACSAEQRDQGMGALIGAAAGAATGAIASGGDPKAIGAGAVAGGAVGWAAVKLTQYQAKKVGSGEDEAQALGYNSSDGVVIKVQKFAANREQVAPGEVVSFDTEYVVLTPSANATASLRENFEVWKDGQLKQKLEGELVTRERGRWNAPADIPIPKGMAPGTYVVKTRIEGSGSYDVAETHFIVTG